MIAHVYMMISERRFRLDVDSFRKWVRRAIAKEGGQLKYADNHGIDRAVMSLVLNGHREPSADFAKAVGWRKETTYTKEKADEQLG